MEIESYDSADSVQVLTGLSYRLRERVEFYLNLDQPLDHIWRSLTKERRNKIRKADKLGVITKIETSPGSLESLFALKCEGLQRRGINLEPTGQTARSATLSLLGSGRAELLVSYFGETPVSVGLFGVFGCRPYHVLSASSTAGRKNAGPSHLIWTMIESLQSRGAKVLNLGGSAIPRSDHDPGAGLYRYKRDFGVTAIPQPAGTKILSYRGAFLSTILERAKRALRPLRKS